MLIILARVCILVFMFVISLYPVMLIISASEVIDKSLDGCNDEVIIKNKALSFLFMNAFYALYLFMFYGSRNSNLIMKTKTISLLITSFCFCFSFAYLVIGRFHPFDVLFVVIGISSITKLILNLAQTGHPF